jgi:hypothetical protein
MTSLSVANTSPYPRVALIQLGFMPAQAGIRSARAVRNLILCIHRSPLGTLSTEVAKAGSIKEG